MDNNISNKNPVEKKKRGRKPKKKSDDNIEPVKEKKKRGRKPKKKIDEPPKEKKKRGRKPTGKIISCVNRKISVVNQDNDCIIAHIPMQMNELEKYLDNDEKTISEERKSSENIFLENKNQEKDDDSIEKSASITNNFFTA